MAKKQKKPSSPYGTRTPPLETRDLRKSLTEFLKTPFWDPDTGIEVKVGDFRWGVYGFFDYDGEPIYVGQTFEMLRSRIRRHLTNQRTDAVAMSVLDPFEVRTIKVWPLPQFQAIVDKKSEEFKAAKKHLEALEWTVYEDAIKKSSFHAILNEKLPYATMKVPIPRVCEGNIVSEEVYKIRSHPDVRISRRALIISRLAQVISERGVKGGLRRVLLVQARRLEWLAEERYDKLGGSKIVPIKKPGEEEKDESEDEE